ncbi:hypothetical protein [Pseudomonas aeruginosa]|uniref:hypothetical protein n=1 Tax=Pseudomonas aeruginosa TaxID=287 RepID=UPI001CD2E9DA|nr:hypothetical protein [Pseudomonas aeruginosa]
MSKELNKAPVEQAEPASCQGTNCGTTNGDHSSECLVEAAASQGWELKPGDLCGRDCPMRPAPAEQAGGDERVIGWRERILAAHPNSDPGFWPDALLVEHMAAEIADLRAALAQLSPASDLDPLNLAPHVEAFNEAPAEALKPEQAEAERPEVVAWRYGFSGGIVSDKACLDEWKSGGEYQSLMTVAQHERIVGALRARNEKLEADAGALEWLRSTFKVHKAIVEQAGCGTIEQLAEQRDAANSRLHEVSVACATAEQERDAALARIAELEAALSSALSQHGVKFMDPPDGGDTPLIEQVCRMSQALSELEKQEPVGEVRESGGTLTAVIVRHSYATKLPVGTKLYAAPVAQAQHSVPEEFSFEYRHPNGESHTVTVSRDQVINEMPDFLFEALCSKFCNCEPVGETNVVECCCDEYAEEFKLLAAAPGKEVGHE